MFINPRENKQTVTDKKATFTSAPKKSSIFTTAKPNIVHDDTPGKTEARVLKQAVENVKEKTDDELFLEAMANPHLGERKNRNNNYSKPRKERPPKVYKLTCEEVCGQINPCGNKYCSSHPDYRPPINTKALRKKQRKAASKS